MSLPVYKAVCNSFAILIVDKLSIQFIAQRQAGMNQRIATFMIGTIHTMNNLTVVLFELTLHPNHSIAVETELPQHMASGI